MEPSPRCRGMEELPDAAAERKRIFDLGQTVEGTVTAGLPLLTDPLFVHLSQGLAYTVGSALGRVAPSTETCLAAFLLPNKVGLTAGARAWSKHFHRSQPREEGEENEGNADSKAVNQASNGGWWGVPSGPVLGINERAQALFWKVINGATWRNLHWLPHQVLVYEVRVLEGYGMRWSQDWNTIEVEEPPWVFRGFVEPMMEDGHEVGWRHSPCST